MVSLGKSNAFEISKKLGIPDSIINRASSLIDKPDTDIESLMKDIYNDRLEIEKEKIETQKNLSQIELLRKSLEAENNEKLIKEQQKVEDAKREAKEILLDAKKQASEVIRSLEHVNDVKKANSIRNELNTKINDIDVNGIDLSVLLKLNNQYESAPPNKKSGKVHIKNNKVQSASTEINLIGETVAVAVEELDKYLDNCKMANLHQVRVVHGKGTGKLREGIHNYLKRSKYVDSFHIAGFGEGDFGVTIVNLK